MLICTHVRTHTHLCTRAHYTHIHIKSRPHRRDKRPLFPFNKSFFCQMLYTFMRICLLWHIPHGQQQRRLVQHLNAVKVMLWPTPYRVATTHRIPCLCGPFPAKKLLWFVAHLRKQPYILWLICRQRPARSVVFATRYSRVFWIVHYTWRNVLFRIIDYKKCCIPSSITSDKM